MFNTNLNQNGNFAISLETPQVANPIIPNMGANTGSIEEKLRSGRYDIRGAQLLSAKFAKEAATNGTGFTVRVVLTGVEREGRTPNAEGKKTLQLQYTLPVDVANFDVSELPADVAATITAKAGKTGFVNANEVLVNAMAENRRIGAGTPVILRGGALVNDKGGFVPFMVIEQA